MGRRGPITDPEKARVRGTWRPDRHTAGSPPAGGGQPPGNGGQGDPPVFQPRGYTAVAREYSRQVLAGEILVCKLILLAVKRQERDLAQRGWEFEWDEDKANAVCAFAEQCPHIEGKWSTALITLEPVQCFILTTLFGWRRKDTGARRFNTAYVEVARKFGKSVLASIIALYCLCKENEPGAQVKCAATTGSQARVVFNVARRMVMASPFLRGDCGLEAMANAIVHDASASSIQPINAKSSTQDGLNPHCTIIDELHAHKDRGLFDVLRSARGSRSNPLSFYITTAGYNLLGVCYEQRSFLIKVLQGIFEADHYFGVIFTLDLAEGDEKGDEPFDESMWIKANPMLGVTPRLQEMSDYAKEAKLSPSSAGEFKTKRLNLWLQSASAWLNMEQWDACADPTLKIEDFTKDLCWMGADLSQVDDLTALAFVFKRADIIYAFLKYYLPEAVVVERSKAVPAYRIWADQGVLTVTDGPVVDYDKVESDVRDAFKKFRVQKVVFDQFGSAQIGSSLITDKMNAELLPKNARTFTQPARELEARIKHGMIRHDGHECLRWQASNVVVSRKIDGTILPKKEHPESPNKIDGIDALLQAIGAMLTGPTKGKGSVCIKCLNGLPCAQHPKTK